MIVDRGYLDHWKTHMLRQLTGLPNAAELPLRLWEYCEWKRDDHIAGSEAVVGGICRATIDPKALVRALLDCRFLDKVRGGYTVHGWRERNASWLRKIEGGKMRSQGAKRGANGQLQTAHPEASNEEASSTADASHQLAGGSAGAVEWSGVEKSREPATTPSTLTRAHGCAGAREGALSETWTFILSLFGAKKRRAGFDAEQALARQAEALPLSAEDRAVLAWFYALPPDEKNVDLRGRFRDADKLAINLFPAIERARRYASTHGGPEKKERAAEPAGWREWFAGRYPDKPVPAQFADLPDYLQSDAWRELGGGDEGERKVA